MEAAARWRTPQQTQQRDVQLAPDLGVDDAIQHRVGHRRRLGHQAGHHGGCDSDLRSVAEQSDHAHHQVGEPGHHERQHQRQDRARCSCLRSDPQPLVLSLQELAPMAPLTHRVISPLMSLAFQASMRMRGRFRIRPPGVDVDVLFLQAPLGVQHRSPDVEIRKSDDAERDDEVAHHHGHHERNVVGRAGQEVEGAGRADAIQNVATPAQHGGHGPQRRPPPDEQDYQQRRRSWRSLVVLAQAVDDGAVAVCGDDSQGVDGDETRHGGDQAVHLAHCKMRKDRL